MNKKDYWSVIFDSFKRELNCKESFEEIKDVFADKSWFLYYYR